MSAPSTSGLSVELLLRVIDVKYGCFTLLLTDSAHFLPKLCFNYARFSKLCRLFLKLFRLQNKRNKSKKRITIMYL